MPKLNFVDIDDRFAPLKYTKHRQNNV